MITRFLAMLVWILALLASAPPAASAQPDAAQYIVRAWGTADGLPQNSVTSIVQTRDGYLWLGTFGGLVRFDGHAFTVFDPDNSPGLRSARIVSLREDSQGVLWIGTESGLTRLEQGRFTSYDASGGVPGGVWAALRDRQGRVWVATDSGLARSDGRQFSIVPTAAVPVPVRGLAESPDGDLWVATWAGVVRFRDGETRTALPPVPGANQVTRCLFFDRQGRLWVGGDKLSWWDGTRFVEVTLPLQWAAGRGAVSALSQDAEGNLWIGTTAGGAFRWRDGVVTAYPAGASLSDRVVRSVLGDSEGNVWIGMEVGGLNRLKRRHVFSYQRPGSEDQSLGPIVGDGADGLWIGATCGGLLHFDGTFRTYLPDTAMNCVWALHRDPDGTVWIGSAGGGLRRFAGGRFTNYGTKDGLLSDTVTGIARDRQGRLWIGSHDGLSRWDGHRFTNYGIAEGLTHDADRIVEDRRGALWIGGVGGLSRFENGRFTRYTTAQGLSLDQVRAIHEDADGVMWIGTYGGGLNRLKDGRFTTYGIKEGLPDSAVSSIIEDSRGNLWMSGNKGVYRVSRSQLNDFAEGRISYITAVSYGTADGMVIDETNGGQPAGWRTPDGRLWFPTIKGLVGIDPPSEAARPPPVYVERAVVDGRPIDPRALPPLGPGSSDAEFHYTAVDLGAGEKTRFRYRLDPYDRAWIDSGTRRVAYYTKVPPGEYRFEVLATDSDGAWSTTPARIAVVVVPFWWQRQPVQIAGLLVLLAATGLGVRSVSLRRARARLAELERERALDRERSRIARDLHDDLGSRLAQIALIAEDPARASPDRISNVAREAMRTMDELVWTVNARHDTVESFGEYAAEFAEEHLTLAGVRYRLQIQPDLGGGRLGADIRRHLYLAFKEAVHNVVKHAGASEVHIGLGVERDRLVLVVADNGRGFPADRDGGTGNGLRNMRERMDAAGGTLAMESADGAGTRLVFRVPIGASPAGT